MAAANVFAVAGTPAECSARLAEYLAVGLDEPIIEVTGTEEERALALDAWGRPLRLNAPWWFWNLFGEQAVFLLSRRDGKLNSSPSPGG